MPVAERDARGESAGMMPHRRCRRGWDGSQPLACDGAAEPWTTSCECESGHPGPSRATSVIVPHPSSRADLLRIQGRTRGTKARCTRCTGREEGEVCGAPCLRCGLAARVMGRRRRFVQLRGTTAPERMNGRESRARRTAHSAGRAAHGWGQEARRKTSSYGSLTCYTLGGRGIPST